jgi:hypothetical protein
MMTACRTLRRSALVLALAGAPTVILAEDAHREHGAHVHGVGWLDVALDGATLELSFKAPGADVAGLEGPPADAADVAKVGTAQRALANSSALFTFEPAGACALEGTADVRPPAAALKAPDAAAKDDHDHDHDHDHEHDHEGAHGHGDWEASWRFRCATAPQAVRFEGFTAFPSLEKVGVQVLGPAGQTAVELTPSARRIPLAAD